MKRRYRIMAFAVAAVIVAIALVLMVNSGIPSSLVRAAGRGDLGAPIADRVGGAQPIIAVAPIVTLTPSPDARLESLDPPPSAPSVSAQSSFYLEIWASNVSNPFDGLACVYVDVRIQPAGAIQASAPAQDSPLFPIQAVPAVFDSDSGVIDDVGGCQTVPATSGLGVGEWVLIKTISMNAAATLGPVNIALQHGGNVLAGPSIIGNVNGVEAAEMTFHNAVVDVECAFGEIPDLEVVAAFQNCFTGRAAKGALDPSCDPFDTDCDRDTDLVDYAGIVDTLLGP